MMFKEYVQHDSKTFINSMEFASEVVINGVTVTVVEDKDQLLNRIQKDYDGLGLVVGDILFYITPEEYAKIPHVSAVPVAHEAVSYNGRPCAVMEVNEQFGMYEITLQKAGAY